MGHLMASYVIGYGIIRFLVEGLRIDTAHHVGGLRWNQWVALIAIVGAGLYIAISSRREVPIEAEAVEPEVAEPEAAAEADEARD